MQEHKQAFDPDLEPTDFTFAYMREMYNRRETGADLGHFRYPPPPLVSLTTIDSSSLMASSPPLTLFIFDKIRN
jgi:hypothetical protein